MATPNYGYEKRQKELAKKRKKEDKLKEKATRKVGDGDVSQGIENDSSVVPGEPGTTDPNSVPTV